MSKIDLNVLIYSSDFKKFPAGKNCPDRSGGLIVLAPNICKDASTALGLTYCGTVNDSSLPAGCYHDYSKSYFNEVVDPSKTNPALFGNKGGICIKGKFCYCRRKGKYLHFYILAE